MKSLVIYFSHTGENYMSDGIRNIDKGNTEIVAENIKELTNADLFKVETIKEYPYKYRECCDVAKEKLLKNYRPELKKTISNLDGYDVIYIGGPIWWGHYPCAIFTILENLDFNSKIVKPFSTHEGSGIGQIMEEINKFCKGATIKEPLAIRGSDAVKSKEILKEWCNN